MQSLQTLSFKSLLDTYHWDKPSLLAIKEKIDGMILEVETKEWKDHFISCDIDGEFTEKINESSMSYLPHNFKLATLVVMSEGELHVTYRGNIYRISKTSLYVVYNGLQWKIPYIPDDIKAYHMIPVDIVRFGAFLWKYQERKIE